MKTKVIEYYIDLFPGWQDCDWLPLPTTNPGEKLAGNKRVKVSVELPVFGGTADVDIVAPAAKSQIVANGMEAR